MEHLIDALIERFKKDNVIDLTQEEELAILNSLTEDDMINNGTSRNVYRFRKDFVVKVAMSTGGVNQNKIERGYYEEHGDSGYFAELYACGEMINIMERLSECCYFDEEELNCYDEEDECYARYQEILNVIENVNDLTDYYGGDNGQVGYSRSDDCYKVYDYGYSMDYDRGEIVDDVECWWCVILPLQNAINVVSGGELLTPGDFWELREKIKGEE